MSQRKDGLMPNNEKMEAIRRGLDLLYIPGDVIELRAFYDTGFDKLSTVSGFFNDLTALTKAINDVNSRMFSNGSGISVYVTANPVKQTWQEVTNKIFWSSKMLRREIKDTGNLETSPRLTHKKNFQTGETYHSLRTTDDTDILSRRWILLDIDAGQPVDTNSTAEEKDNAYKMESAVRDYLNTWGFPPLTLCGCGTGWHSLVRLDFPNTPEVADIVKRFLASIAKKFDGKFGTAHLDTGVYNAARIVKAYGSKVFKGTNTLERPWRSSSVIHAPVETHIVTLEQVKKLADEFAPAGTWTGASALSDPEHRARVE